MGKESGPKQDLYFKVFPNGTCQVPGVISGYPVLDAEPYGLGWVAHPTVHTFSALQVSLLRLELERRNQYDEAKKQHSELAARLSVRDSARLCVEEIMPLSRKPVAIVTLETFAWRQVRGP